MIMTRTSDDFDLVSEKARKTCQLMQKICDKSLRDALEEARGKILPTS